MLEFLSNVYNDTFDRIKGIEFDKDSLYHCIIISLYASIIEQTGSAITLLKAGRYTGVNIIERSSLEAYIDLVNLVKDPGYLQQMKAAWHKEWLKLSNAGLAGDSEVVKSLPQGDLNEAISYHQRSFDRLKAKGIKPLMPAERFARADQRSLYETIYNELCADSHNNIRALNERHIREVDGKTEVVMFRKPKDEALKMAIQTILSTYIEAGGLTHCFFGSRGEEVMEHYANMMRSMPQFSKS